MAKTNSRLRFPLLALAMAALLAALWAGVVRLGWGWPPLQPALPMSHGPLMVGGFLGTLIGIERAVALAAFPHTGIDSRWFYAGPLLTAVGAVLLLAGVPGVWGPLLITLGSVGLALVFGLIVRIQLAAYTLIMAGGVLCWLAGNILWLFGWPVYQVVLWWAAFLILTIAGERLELNRVLRLSSRVQTMFLIALVPFLVGVIFSSITGLFDLGMRLAGAGMVGLAFWLLRYDIARKTIRKSGLSRFMAACLLAGYGWLAAGGVLSLFFGGITAGPYYDAVLYAIFVGFVISMIFGHAPIVFPSVLGRPLAYHRFFYLHLALLHLSLVLRVAGDVLFWLPGRQWGDC